MKSKYFYDYKRNIDENKIMQEISDRNIPDYYIGSTYMYEARKVIEDWCLSYNVGTAVTYLLRAGKKKEEGMTDKQKHLDDLKKAINHIEFEIEKLNNK